MPRRTTTRDRGGKSTSRACRFADASRKLRLSGHSEDPIIGLDSAAGWLQTSRKEIVSLDWLNISHRTRSSRCVTSHVRGKRHLWGRHYERQPDFFNGNRTGNGGVIRLARRSADGGRSEVVLSNAILGSV